MRLLVISLVLLSAGCSSDRVAKLEKENQELRTRLAVSDLDAQQKCSKDADQYFRLHWGSPDERTLALNYSIHYSRKQGKCFIEVNYSFKGISANDVTELTTTANNVYGGENVAANFHEVSTIHADLTKPPTREVINCVVTGMASCKTEGEFRKALTAFYGEE